MKEPTIINKDHREYQLFSFIIVNYCSANTNAAKKNMKQKVKKNAADVFSQLSHFLAYTPLQTIVASLNINCFIWQQIVRKRKLETASVTRWVTIEKKN